MSDKNKRTSDYKEISHSLGNDFKIIRNSTKFPIPLYPSYSRRAVVAFCTEGRAKVDVHELNICLRKGNFKDINSISGEFFLRNNIYTEFKW